MTIDNDYTLLPFYDPLMTAKLLVFAVAALVLVYIVKAIVFKKSLTLHRAPTSILFAYVSTSLINILLCTFLYWQWALGVSLLMSVIFAFVTAGEVRDANTEERIGVWGLNRDIRRIRGELFNDMSVEEQIKYRENVKETRFSYVLFVIVTFAAAALFIFVCTQLDIGYLLKPVLVEN